MKISVLPRSRGSEVCFQFPASQSVTTALSEGNKNVMIIICIVSRNNWAGGACRPRVYNGESADYLFPFPSKVKEQLPEKVLKG